MALAIAYAQVPLVYDYQERHPRAIRLVPISFYPHYLSTHTLLKSITLRKFREIFRTTL